MEIQVNGAVTSIWENIMPGWSKWAFFTSDNHFDSIQCNRELLKADFEEAKARNAWIAIFGDWFDAMQGRFDPRRSNDELRPEYRRSDYYDYVITDGAEFLAPYAENILMLSRGNHENSVLKNANTDMISRMAAEIRMLTGVRITTGGYGGWIRMMFNMSNGENTGPRISLKTKYFHGSGGEAPVTRGAIQTNRQAVYLPDADIVVNGHSHNAYYIPIERERLSNKGVQYFDTQHHIRIPGYKQAYADGQGGWEVERGGAPKPLGSWFVRLVCENNRIRVIPTPQFDHPNPIPSLPSGEYVDYPEYPQDSEYP